MSDVMRESYSPVAEFRRTTQRHRCETRYFEGIFRQ